MKKPLEILLQKARQDQLAHFYILECHLPEEESFPVLYSFAQTFISDYYTQVEHQKIIPQDHPDVFVLGGRPEDEDRGSTNYTVEQAEALARFFNFRPVQGQRKFAIITEGHRITQVVANKWLKLFEEPQGLVTIFLLNPRGQQLLPTIHSRALHLRLAASMKKIDRNEWEQFLKDAQSMSLYEFLELYNKGERPLSFWNDQLLQWEADQFDRPQDKEALTTWLKKLNEMEVFRQPSATIWTLFYSFLHQHVLPRLGR
jgi:hypothetical protein